jgi:RNA polymerase sigma factor (sigma-70 family)
MQRAELALKLKPIIAAKAKEKQREAGETKLPQNSARASDTRKELAKIAGCSHDTINKVERIQKSPTSPDPAEVENQVLQALAKSNIPERLRDDYLGTGYERWLSIGDVPDRLKTLISFLNQSYRNHRLGHEYQSNHIPHKKTLATDPDGNKRVKRSRYEVRLTDDMDFAREHDGFQAVDDEDEIAWMRSRLDLLPGRDRQIVDLHIAGKSQGEIAKVVGLSRKTVNEELQRIKELLSGYSRNQPASFLIEGEYFAEPQNKSGESMLSISQAAKELESTLGQSVPPHLISGLFFRKLLDEKTGPMIAGRRVILPSALPLIASKLRQHVRRFHSEASK